MMLTGPLRTVLNGFPRVLIRGDPIGVAYLSSMV